MFSIDSQNALCKAFEEQIGNALSLYSKLITDNSFLYRFVRVLRKSLREQDAKQLETWLNARGYDTTLSDISFLFNNVFSSINLLEGDYYLSTPTKNLLLKIHEGKVFVDGVEMDYDYEFFTLSFNSDVKGELNFYNEQGKSTFVIGKLGQDFVFGEFKKGDPLLIPADVNKRIRNIKKITEFLFKLLSGISALDSSRNKEFLYEIDKKITKLYPQYQTIRRRIDTGRTYSKFGKHVIVGSKKKLVPSFYLDETSTDPTPSQQRAKSYLDGLDAPNSPKRLALLYVAQHYWKHPGDIDAYFNEGQGFYLADYLVQLHKNITYDQQHALTFYSGFYTTTLSGTEYLDLSMNPVSDTDAAIVVKLGDTVINNPLYAEGQLTWDFAPPGGTPNKTSGSITFKSVYGKDDDASEEALPNNYR
ncbi:MAG TPA: hypothetical protein QKA08_02390 [Candidatus Megaira endosymbiont of Nemacystus decipiens]|nr:hypothetical protein [Candidatus Megaera endosymbiont of Nemacystus decipiens]